jgi:hypothetical protein
MIDQNLLQQIMQNMQNTSALQPGFGADGTSAGEAVAPANPAAGPQQQDPLVQALSALKSVQPEKPIFSGGAGLPFLQQMPNLITPALQQAFGRIGKQPSLGQYLGGR